jgi:hypothetical protein
MIYMRLFKIYLLKINMRTRFSWLMYGMLLLSLMLTRVSAVTCSEYTIGTLWANACPAPGAVLDDMTTWFCDPTKCKLKILYFIINLISYAFGYFMLDRIKKHFSIYE